MNPALVIFGIQATLRAAQAGADLYREHAHDRKIFLPNLELPGGSKTAQLREFIRENLQLLDTTPELSEIWDTENNRLKTSKSKLFDPAYAFMLEHTTKLQLQNEGKDENDARFEAKLLAGGHMVEQWRKERKPPSAFIRMALTLTDIGLEFVSANPSILGVSSRGEKLIVAFANNMSVLLPDDVDDFGPAAGFADRVLGIFLRAGLGSLTSNASTVFKDEDVAKLFEGVAKPIVDALPDDILEQIDYRDIVDAIAGPSAEAAFKVLAENTETYFGKNFAADKALGVVTSALFDQIKATAGESSIVDVFSEQGMISLYQAGLRVAMERPGLFVYTSDDEKSAKTKLFEDLILGTAATLHKYPRFKGPVGASLAAMALEVVGGNAQVLLNLNPEEPWEKVMVTALEQVTTGLAEALNNVDEEGSTLGALKSFSDGQLLELGRVVLTQVAQTPGMLGIERSEVQLIVAGMAEAMAGDEKLLLSADQWIEIAGIAARKAASNPGRLFGISTEDQVGALAVIVIKSVLTVAGQTWTANGRSDRPLLFGETLTAVIEEMVGALAGNVAAVANQPGLVDQFVQKILTMAASNPEKIGSEGVLKIVQAFIGQVLASGTLPNNEEINTILSA